MDKRQRAALQALKRQPPRITRTYQPQDWPPPSLGQKTGQVWWLVDMLERINRVEQAWNRGIGA